MRGDTVKQFSPSRGVLAVIELLWLIYDKELYIVRIGRIGGMGGIEVILRDKYGWPVERIQGHKVTNFIRLLIHTNIKQTFIRRKTMMIKN